MRRTAQLLARRLGEGLGVLASVTVITFLLVSLAPGDAATAIAQERYGENATAAQIRAIRHELRLDGPLPQRFWREISTAAHGDLGTSLRTGAPVATEIRQRIGATALLALSGGLLAVIAGVGLGLLAAAVRLRSTRFLLRVVGLLAVSVPGFVMAYALVLELALRHRLLPTQGQESLRSWVLPSAVLALPFAGALSRVVLAAVETALAEPFALTARARGLPAAVILLREALPNAGVTILNVAGTGLGQLLGQTVVVEVVFSWPGLGAYFLRAVTFRDLPVIQATTLVFTVGFLLVRSLAATSSALLDPRTRTT